MRIAASLKLLTFLVPCAFLVPVVIAFAPDLNKVWNSEALQNIKTVFVSIFLEAAPFLLMGVFLSSLMQWFVSEEMVRRLTPKHPVGGVLVAGLLGIVFPICECGMIPVVRRLMHKGMPAYIAVTFILSGPVVNPIVFTATLMAFPSHLELTIARMGLAFAVGWRRWWACVCFCETQSSAHAQNGHDGSKDTSWVQNGFLSSFS